MVYLEHLSIDLLIFVLLFVIVILYFVYNLKKDNVTESFKLKRMKRMKKIKKEVKSVIRNANNHSSADFKNHSSADFKNISTACNNKYNRKLERQKNICEQKQQSLAINSERILREKKSKCRTQKNRLRQKSNQIISNKEKENYELQNTVDMLEQSLVNEKIKSSNFEVQLQENQDQLERLKSNTIAMRSSNLNR